MSWLLAACVAMMPGGAYTLGGNESLDECRIVDLATPLWIGLLDHLVCLGLGQPLAQTRHDVAQLGRRYAPAAILIKDTEGIGQLRLQLCRRWGWRKRACQGTDCRQRNSIRRRGVELGSVGSQVGLGRVEADGAKD